FERNSRLGFGGRRRSFLVARGMDLGMGPSGSRDIAGKRREAGGFESGIARPGSESRRRVGFLDRRRIPSPGGRHDFDGLGGNRPVRRLARLIAPDARPPAAPAAPPATPIAIRLAILIAALARFPDRRLGLLLRTLARFGYDGSRHGTTLPGVFRTTSATTATATAALLLALLLARRGLDAG